MYPRAYLGGDKELAPVRPRSRVGHREEPRHRVLHPPVLELVRERGAVDTLPAGAVAGGEVAPLEHEPGDDAVEAAREDE